MPGDTEQLSARLDRIESELAVHRDILAIQDVLTRYSRALDWLDAKMIEDIFFDDAEIDYGFFKGNGKDFKPLLIEFERGIGRRWHFTSQIKIALDGDRAEVESYNFSVASEQVSPGEGTRIMQFFGKYIDRLERRGGRWGIARRHHLQVSGVVTEEVAITGDLALLNQIGPATPEHPEYRSLA